MDKKEAKELIQKKLDQINELEKLDINNDEQSAEFELWEHETSDILENIFGTDSTPYKRFKELHFHAMVIPDDRYELEKLESQIFIKGLHSAKAVLRSILVQIDNFGVKKSASTLESFTHSTQQKIHNRGGKVISPTFKDVKVGGDLIVGESVSKESLKELGLDIEINYLEHLLIKFGRLLLSKLGARNFLIFIISVMGISGGWLSYDLFVFRANLTFLTDNIYQFIITLFIFVFSLSLSLYGKYSKCRYCGKQYATVPIRKTILGKGEYRGSAYYKVKELRQCENCLKINYKEYTERGFESQI